MHTPNTGDALEAAVAAIYFGDNSDYCTALWDVVASLGGDDAKLLLQEDSQAAFDKFCNRNKMPNQPSPPDRKGGDDRGNNKHLARPSGR